MQKTLDLEMKIQDQVNLTENLKKLLEARDQELKDAKLENQRVEKLYNSNKNQTMDLVKQVNDQFQVKQG